jgi:putative transposase
VQNRRPAKTRASTNSEADERIQLKIERALEKEREAAKTYREAREAREAQRQGKVIQQPHALPAGQPHEPQEEEQQEQEQPEVAGPSPRSLDYHKSRHVNVDSVVMSLASKGLTYRQISSHLDEVYNAAVSPDAVKRITDRVLDELTDWLTRPLDPVYPVIFIDAMVVKIRGGRVANRPVHTAVGINLEGQRDFLGLWISEGAEGAKYWHEVLTEIANRGVDDVCFVVCDGLKGLPDAVNDVWPQAIVQTCVLHLLRNTVRYASKTVGHRVLRDARAMYTAPSERAARARFDEFRETWEERYPAIIRLWENAWPEFVPFLSYSRDIREVIYTTNTIENVHSRLRQAVRTHGYFQSEEAALKYLYLAIRSFDPTGLARLRGGNKWKAALNAFAITFEGRIHLNY